MPRPYLLRLTLAAAMLLTLLSPASAQRRTRVTLGLGFQQLAYQSGIGPSTTASGRDNPFLFGLSRDIGGVKINPNDIPVKTSGDIDVTLVDIKAGEILPLALYADAFQYDGIVFGSGVQVVGGGISLRKRHKAVYFGAGAGLYQTRIPAAVFTLDGASVGVRNKIRPGAKLFLGAETRSPFFVELNYTEVFSSPARPGAGMVLGLRF